MLQNDAPKPPGRGKKNPLAVLPYSVLHRKRKQTNRGENIKKQRVQPPLTNQMMDSLEGYLDNIATVAMKTAANVGPLA